MTKDLWGYGEWMFHAMLNKKKTQARNDYARLTTHYDIGDYDIRKRGDHWEGYNMKTGEVLTEGVSYDETVKNLREAFEEA